jgi:hypothetical protein
MKDVSNITDEIAKKLSEIVTQTGDFTLTWEELIDGLTEGKEDTILRSLTRYVSSIKYSSNNFESLKNPNLFSIEDMVFEDSELESFYICYNDLEIVFISRDLTPRVTSALSSEAVAIDPNNPNPIITLERPKRYKYSRRNSF